MKRIHVLYVHPDGQPDNDYHRAARVTVKTFPDGSATVKLRDRRGRTVEAYHYGRYSRIRIRRKGRGS